MESVIAIDKNPPLSKKMHSKIHTFLRDYWQLIVIVAVLIGVNWPLLSGGIPTDLIFFPEAVGNGQWWRVLTFPLVHLSWYHLLMDGGAFLLLYHCLEENRFVCRLGYVIGAGSGSLLLALVLEPSMAFRGLCGLSGIAHGLMAAAALDMIKRDDHRFLGLLSLVVVVLKSAWELWTGQVVFASLHLGDYGTPLVACHAGGILGAMLVYGFINRCQRRCKSS